MCWNVPYIYCLQIFLCLFKKSTPLYEENSIKMLFYHFDNWKDHDDTKGFWRVNIHSVSSPLNLTYNKQGWASMCLI